MGETRICGSFLFRSPSCSFPSSLLEEHFVVAELATQAGLDDVVTVTVSSASQAQPIAAPASVLWTRLAERLQWSI